MEDDGIMNHIKLLLERKAKKGKGAFDEIIEVLKGESFFSNLIGLLHFNSRVCRIQRLES